jgi:hypothetical protein
VLDPVELLARDDAWCLGAGDGALFAPATPVWLDSPGYWDGATVGDVPFAPLFTVTILDEDGDELPLKLASRRWTPAELTAEFRLPNGITATEVRTVHPGGVFVSEWRLRALRPLAVHLVAWTVQPVDALDAAATRWNGALEFSRRVLRPGGAWTTVPASLACLGDTTSWVALPAGAIGGAPQWAATPLGEVWAADRFPRAVRVATRPAERTICMAVHRAVHVADAGSSATFALRLAPDGAIAGAPPAGPHGATLAGASRRRWHERFGRVPHLRCSDPFVETAFWHRWAGLWLNETVIGQGDAAVVAVREHARGAVTARATAAVLRELRWVDVRIARQLMRAWAATVRVDGALPARLADATAPDATPADWGAALAALDAIAPDDRFLAEIIEPLGRHAEWMITSAATAAGDRTNGDRGLRWAVCAHRLSSALEGMAERAGVPEQAGRWREGAARAGATIARALGDAGLLQGVHPSASPSAMPFLALGTDVPTAEQGTALLRALHDPARFWTPFPVPARALGDSDAVWRAAAPVGDDDCPDAARLVPWLDCAIADALALESVDRPELRASVAHLLARLVRATFASGDLRRPSARAHYNPLTGQGSADDGIADQQRTWLADALLQYAAGVRPHTGGVTIDPFPFGFDTLRVTNLHVRGKTLEVRITGNRVKASVDGIEHETALGTAIELPD